MHEMHNASFYYESWSKHDESPLVMHELIDDACNVPKLWLEYVGFE